MNDLIGQSFRRNKYGLSTWEDEITDVYFARKWLVEIELRRLPVSSWKAGFKERQEHGYKAVAMVRGKKSGIVYELSEIIIYP